MTLSLNVIIHITQLADFIDHINDLTNSSSRFICVYSSAFSHDSRQSFTYMRSWDVVSAFRLLKPEIKLVHYWANPAPYIENVSNDQETSVCDFFVFEKSRPDLDVPARYWSP